MIRPAALPRGFRFAAVNCGLRKPPNLDLGLILAERPGGYRWRLHAKSSVAAPVVLTRDHLSAAASRIRAVIVNSKNANCATGPSGMTKSLRDRQEVAKAMDCAPETNFGLFHRRHRGPCACNESWRRFPVSCKLRPLAPKPSTDSLAP